MPTTAGYRPSFPDVHRPCGSGHLVHLPELASEEHLQLLRHRHRNPIPFDFHLTQHPPHPFDRCPTHPAQQKHSACHVCSGQNEWGAQCHRDYAYRVFCSLRCYFTLIYWHVGRRGLVLGYFPPDPRSDPGYRSILHHPLCWFEMDTKIS